jgi:hypothetical protein
MVPQAGGSEAAMTLRGDYDPNDGRLPRYGERGYIPNQANRDTPIAIRDPRGWGFLSLYIIGACIGTVVLAGWLIFQSIGG